MSFMVNQDDKVYQANLGRETEKNVAKINKFNADAHWQTVE